MYTKFELKTNRVKGISLHPKCPWILVALHSGVIKLWDYNQSSLLHSFTGHDGPVRAVSFHKTLSIFVSGGDDYTVRVWDWKKKMFLFNLKGHSDYVRTTFFHEESPWIISASDDQSIRIWNWQSRSCISVLSGHTHYVMCANFHPTEPLVVSASLDQTVRVWDISGLRSMSQNAPSQVFTDTSENSPGILDTLIKIDVCVKFILEGHECGVNWAEFHPREPLIVSASDDKTVRLWRMSGSQAWEVDTFRDHNSNVCAVVFHHTDDILISSSEDKTVKVWNVQKRTVEKTIKKEGSRFWSITVHPRLNVFAAGHDNGFFVFKLERERPVYCLSDDAVYYIQKSALRSYDTVAEKDRQVFVFPHSLKASIDKPREISYNSNDNLLIISSPANGNCYFMYKLKPRGASSRANSSNTSELIRSDGFCAKFTSNKIINLCRINNNILFVKNFSNVTLQEINLGMNTRTLYPIDDNKVLIIGKYEACICDISLGKVCSKISVQARHAKISPSGKYIALLLKKKIGIFNLNLQHISRVSEGVKIKTGEWYNNNIFIYSNFQQIKYMLPNGDTGIICSILDQLYITKIVDTTLICLNHKSQVSKTRLDLTECLFKQSVVCDDSEAVQNIIQNSNLVGQAVLCYLQSKGRSEIPLNLFRDPKSKFNMAISCGNINVALEAAKTLNKSAIWETLAREAILCGNFEVAEVAYQKLNNVIRLGFLYFIMGNSKNLSKMLPIYLALQNYSTAYLHALMLNDTETQIGVLLKSNKPFLAYLTAKSSNNDLAQKIYEGSGIQRDIKVEPKESELFNIENSVKNDIRKSWIPSLEAASVESPKSSTPKNQRVNLVDIHGESSDEISPSVVSSEITQLSFSEVFQDCIKWLRENMGIVYIDGLEEIAKSQSKEVYTSYREAGPSAPITDRLPFIDIKEQFETYFNEGSENFTSGSFAQSLKSFRNSLRSLALYSFNCTREEFPYAEMRKASQCILAILLETRRRKLAARHPDEIEARLETAYLLSSVELSKAHKILILRTVLKTLMDLGNKKSALFYAEKIISMKPQESTLNRIKGIVSELGDYPNDPHQIDIQLDPPPEICCRSLKAISKGEKFDECSFCSSPHKNMGDDQNSKCRICEMTII